MKDEYRNNVIENFFIEDFFEKEPTGNYRLEEKEKKGETVFLFKTAGIASMAIKNVDKKNTEFAFFRTEKVLSLKKRVDHIVFEQEENHKWRVHLIEMKSGISTKEKWLEIKGKFRASYFLVQALGAILQMEIQDIRMYTTYERISLESMPENPVSRRAYVGKIPENLMAEWRGEAFSLRFGEGCRIPFLHIPVQVFRKGNQRLEGEYCCGGEKE